jgi:O-antigen/teichoic acid export membrane protein
MIDRFLLNSMDPATAERLYGQDITPEDVVGIYSACYKLAVFMLLIVQMYRMAWQPFFMRYSRDEDSAKLFGRAFVYFNAFAATAYLVVSLFREQIVGISIFRRASSSKRRHRFCTRLRCWEPELRLHQTLRLFLILE